jgi:tRNA threonylcarbamoyladenosine modification (KEOPS) complex Cgi121 subunit
VAVQAVNADLVAGIQHVMGILYQSLEAKKRRILLSKRIEVDILLRLACTDQIDKALTNVGIKEGRNNVLVIALGRINSLKMLRKYIAKNYGMDDNVLAPSKRRLKDISTLHGIGRVELDALVNGSNKLSSLLIELASLL